MVTGRNSWTPSNRGAAANRSPHKQKFGAALLALSWSSLRGYLADDWEQVEIVVELEAAFTVLASIGLLRHLLVGSWPWYTWWLSWS